jgi:diacylglycerol O-acyltransferase / wax synthase
VSSRSSKVVPLLDQDGRCRIDAVRRAVGERLCLVPRLRQVLHVPHLGLGRPLWVDARSLDLSWHVRTVPVPAPGGEAELLLTVERLRRRRLDRSRPLSEMWFLTGLPQGRTGLFVKVHHVVADGVARVALLASLLGADPFAADRTPVPVPSSRDLFMDNLRRRWWELAHALRPLVRPRRTLWALRSVWPAGREILAGERAPRTSVNRPIGMGRRLAVVRGRLDVMKEVAHANDATVNDVLMTVIAGGLHDLLNARGERADDLVPRAYVPVSLHGEQAQGNRGGMMIVPLPLGVTDPVHRLRLIAAETVERRRLSRLSGGASLRNGLLQRVFLKVMARQRWANVYVANVPGPLARLHLAGGSLLELFPVVPLIGNVTLGIGALSYAGQLNLTIVADEDACPDIDVFVEGIRGTLRSLTAHHCRPCCTPRSDAETGCEESSVAGLVRQFAEYGVDEVGDGGGYGVGQADTEAGVLHFDCVEHEPAG